jgi:predicted AlkP superfamily pyrophosphatase or phosphodiesterase
MMRAPAKAATILTLLACSASAGHAQQAATPGPQNAPRLVVLVAVDQLLPEYFTRYEHQLTGGLGRFWRNGAVFLNAFQDHGVTETAPGHSTMLSGRHPYSTGVVSNALGVSGPGSPLVGGGGAGASPHRFNGTTLVDWLLARHPESRALSVSRKDRGAILPVGKSRQQVYWYASDGRFTTSTYYSDTLPGWVRKFNGRRIPHSYAGRAWNLLLGEENYPEPDSIPQENRGANFVFPHVLPADTAQAVRAFAGTPWMDKLTFEIALQGVEELGLGTGPAPDLLVISLSATDAVGHTWGPASREVHDQVLRLDRYLGQFMASLYRIRDSSTIAFALAGDHGVAPYPELASREHNLPVLRADLRAAFQPVARLIADGRIDSTAIRFESGIISVDRESLRRRRVDPDSLIRSLQRSITETPGVLRVDDVRTLARADTTSDHIARRWRHMVPRDGSAALVVTLHPYVYWSGVTYATHGSPHDYDAHVPLAFYGPWFATGRHEQRASVVDLGPTLAALLRVTPTERVDGRVLSGAMRR